MLSARDVALRFGLKRHQRSWRGNCPNCGYAAGAFSVLEGKGGRPRMYCANGCSWEELRRLLADETGRFSDDNAQSSDDVPVSRERRLERALAIWRSSEPAFGTLADRYLAARGLSGLASSLSLRFRSDCPHPEHPRLPALVALVTDVSGRPQGVHRTFLGRDARKANVEPVRASVGLVRGGAIRLQPFAEGQPLIIGEGIESSASASRLLGVAAWAALSAGNLARSLLLPSEVRRVVIAADPDEVGRSAAREAWTRWKAEGRNVRIALPDGAADFNDLLRSKETANAG